MTSVLCFVFLPFFQLRYTISFPDFSSSDASMLSMWSSHDPAGGCHAPALAALAGGVESAGCPFRRARLLDVAPAAAAGLRPRFFVLAASCVSSIIWSMPPRSARYCSRMDSAPSLRAAVS